MIGRIGGDEFAVFVTGSGNINYDIFLERSNENLQAFNNEKDCKHELSLSVGQQYNSPENPCSLNELLIRADRSMYEQKSK